MKTPPEHERLLDDVLAGSGDFRALSLAAVLDEARRHRHARQRNRALAVAAVVALASAWLLWKPQPAGPQRLASPVSRPVTHDMLRIASTPLPASMRVFSTVDAARVIRSAPSNLASVETSAAAPPVPVIGDTELFTLLAGRPAALVRLGNGPTELLLLNESDRAGFAVP